MKRSGKESKASKGGHLGGAFKARQILGQPSNRAVDAENLKQKARQLRAVTQIAIHEARDRAKLINLQTAAIAARARRLFADERLQYHLRRMIDDIHEDEKELTRKVRMACLAIDTESAIACEKVALETEKRCGREMPDYQRRVEALEDRLRAAIENVVNLMDDAYEEIQETDEYIRHKLSVLQEAYRHKAVMEQAVRRQLVPPEHQSEVSRRVADGNHPIQMALPQNSVGAADLPHLSAAQERSAMEQAAAKAVQAAQPQIEAAMPPSRAPGALGSPSHGSPSHGSPTRGNSPHSR